MLSRIRNNKSFSLAFWISVALFGLPAIAYAASIVLNPGEYVGLGDTSGRIVFNENGTIDDIEFRDGRVIIREGDVGINVPAPGQKLIRVLFS